MAIKKSLAGLDKRATIPPLSYCDESADRCLTADTALPRFMVNGRRFASKLVNMGNDP